MAELFGISKGVICQQVNYRGAYGAGLSGIIAKKFPQVQESYKEFCSKYSSPDDSLGEYSICTLDADERTFWEWQIFLHKEIMEMRHSGIGCGLADEKWEILYPQLKNLNLSNLYLIDTFTNETEKV